MIQPPAFWWRDPASPGLAPRLLAPLARLYADATARRVARPPEWQAGIPAICVGNLTVGGSGKTPTVIALLGEAVRRGRSPVVVTRGYAAARRGRLRSIPAP